MLHPNTVTICHLTAWIVLLSATWHVHQLVLKAGNETWACVARLGQQGTQRLGTTFFFFFPISTLLFGLSFCLSFHTVLMISHDGKWQHSNTATVLRASGQLLCKGGPKDKGSGAAVQLRNSAWAASRVCVCCWACSNLWRRCWMPAGFLGCMFVGKILESEDWSGLVPASGISTGFVLCCFSWRYVREMMRL